jgi:hypothetical protein
MNFSKLTKQEQSYARALRDRAQRIAEETNDLELAEEATVSQIAKDMTGWERRIRSAEREARRP